MAVRLEHAGGAAATTLTSSITNASTTINIASATGWPTGSVGPFVVTVDAGTASEEKVLVLSRSGTVLTVSTRGYDSTVATSHGSTAAIIHSFSATEADEANVAAVALTGLTAATIARGTLGYAQVVTSQGSITAVVDLTGLVVTVPVGSGRRIRITGSTQPSSTAAADIPRLQIQEGAIVLQTRDRLLGAVSAQNELSASVILTPTAGAHTYKLTMQRASGTDLVTNNASATAPSFIHVEDCGV